MMPTFGNPLRVGLTVGVAGRLASPDNEVRLGDIAVSVPSPGSPESYNMTTANWEKMGELHPAKMPASPPDALLATSATIKMIALRGRSSLARFRRNGVEKNEYAQEKFCRPEPETDLFTVKSKSLHVCDIVYAVHKYCGNRPRSNK
ncbi:hypothetical protein BDW75DRAFT_30350 [Aspergillus navahoensis]